MSHITLYIATSLDGYIADSKGGVGWLDEVTDEGEDYGYTAFYASIDALVMGRTTYDQVLTFGDWPYAGKPCYVFTSRTAASERDDVHFVGDLPSEAAAAWAAQGYGHVWLVGGADLTAAFLREGLIDSFVITYIPVLLGAGIPLFQQQKRFPNTHLKLQESKNWPSGIVQLHYTMNDKAANKPG